MENNYYGNSAVGDNYADDPEIPAMTIANEIILPIYQWLQPLVARGEQIGNLDMTKAKAFVDKVTLILEETNGASESRDCEAGL